MKCTPGGMSLTPLNFSSVVQEFQSIPNSPPGSKSRRTKNAPWSNSCADVESSIFKSFPKLFSLQFKCIHYSSLYQKTLFGRRRTFEADRFSANHRRILFQPIGNQKLFIEESSEKMKNEITDAGFRSKLIIFSNQEISQSQNFESQPIFF